MQCVENKCEPINELKLSRLKKKIVYLYYTFKHRDKLPKLQTMLRNVKLSHGVRSVTTRTLRKRQLWQFMLYSSGEMVIKIK